MSLPLLDERLWNEGLEELAGDWIVSDCSNVATGFDVLEDSGDPWVIRPVFEATECFAEG